MNTIQLNYNAVMIPSGCEYLQADVFANNAKLIIIKNNTVPYQAIMICFLTIACSLALRVNRQIIITFNTSLTRVMARERVKVRAQNQGLKSRA